VVIAGELATRARAGKDSRVSDTDGPDIDMLQHELAEESGSYGFDLVTHTTVAAYHRVLGLSGDGDAFRLPDYPSHRTLTPNPDGSRPSRVVFLIGNTRAAWPHFMATLDAQPARRSDPHPFDRWTSEVITRVVVAVVGPHYGFDVRFVFEGGVRAFSALHLAEATGLAYRGPAGLAVNPLLGPWFALRAAITIDINGIEAPTPDPVCRRCVGQPCVAALNRAMADKSTSEVDHGVLRERWRDWLAVRDACPEGTSLRYSDAQIRWHYGHDRGALE